ncbi:MAG: F0F1 ATP synthase subunit delta [Eubacteriales bacterium]
MLNGTLARRYAQALFELAVEMSVLDRIDKEFKEIAQLIDQNSELKYILNHPNIGLSAKKNILEKIFSDEMSDVTKHFVYLLVDRRRQNLVVYIQHEFSKLADDVRQILEAKVTSALLLSTVQENSLKNVLEKTTGKKIRLVTEVDQSMIGGAKLQIGDRVMDGTIYYALQKMRKELKNTSYKPQQEVGVS